MAEVEVRVWQLGRDSELKYVVILRDASERFLPIRIGPCEFSSISQTLLPKSASDGPWRPRAHDLICSLVERMGARITKVVIDDLWDDVFFAQIHLSIDGKSLTVDARPSDAIAVALRSSAPLFCEGAVLAAAGESASSQRDGLDEFLDASDLE